MKSKVLIISGATATGKTALALKLANQFGAELISADSRQVYQEMDIVTGKDLPKKASFSQDIKLSKALNLDIGKYDFAGIPVWGLDLVKPDGEFSIAHFYRFVEPVIQNIISRDKLPIIVGGTGFYLKTLWQTPETLFVPQNCSLRNHLNLQSTQNLQDELQKLDNQKFTQMNYSDQNNPRRLIRAIEVAKFKKQNLDQLKNYHKLDFDILHLNIYTDLDLLAGKIKKRVITRLNDGAIKETQNLLQKYHKNLPSLSALRYKEIQIYLDNKITKQELIDLWSLHELQYAKRQLTFFKKLKNIRRIYSENREYLSQTKLLVQKWLRNR